jgi:hypothetical protein
LAVNELHRPRRGGGCNVVLLHCIVVHSRRGGKLLVGFLVFQRHFVASFVQSGFK